MSVATILGRVDRCVSAWTNGKSPDRLAIALLAVFTAAWTVYGTLSKANQDVHHDTGELVSWSREGAGAHHPAMAAWIAGAWFRLFPLEDWAAYLLAMTNVAVALWIAWLVFREWLDPVKSLAGLGMLCLIPLHTFQALKYNANTVMLPFWAATIYFFVKSYRTQGPVHAALAGAAGAGALLGKYWSVFLIAGLAAAALIDRRRSAYWRSAAPYISIAVGLALVAPHVASVVSGSSDSMRFVSESVRQAWTIETSVLKSLEYLLGALGYASPAILILFLLRPSGAALKDIVRPMDEDRRLVAAIFWVPLLLPALLNLFVPTRLSSVWTIPNWLLLPLVLLQSPKLSVTRKGAVRIAAGAAAVSILLALVSPLIALTTHATGVSRHAYYRSLADVVQREWESATDRPLRFLGGNLDLAQGASFYLPSGAATPPERIQDADLEQSGIAIVCRSEDQECLRSAEAIRPNSRRRTDVTLTRSLWGMNPQSRNFTILIVPPLEGQD